MASSLFRMQTTNGARLRARSDGVPSFSARSTFLSYDAFFLSDRSGRALVHGAADLDSFRGSYVLIAAVSVGRTWREPPNKRLKLTAPVVYGRIPFVIIPAWRRSL